MLDVPTRAESVNVRLFEQSRNRVRFEKNLDLDGGNIFTAASNHILFAIDEMHQSISIEINQGTGLEVVICPCFGCRLRIF